MPFTLKVNFDLDILYKRPPILSRLLALFFCVDCSFLKELMTAWQIVGSLQGAQMKRLLLQRIKLQFLVNHCQAIFFPNPGRIGNRKCYG